MKHGNKTKVYSAPFGYHVNDENPQNVIFGRTVCDALHLTAMSVERIEMHKPFCKKLS